MTTRWVRYDKHTVLHSPRIEGELNKTIASVARMK